MDFAWSTVRWACTNDKFGQSGGWMRIANVDMKNNQLRCPPDWSTVSLTERGRLGHKPTLVPGCSALQLRSAHRKWNTDKSVVK